MLWPTRDNEWWSLERQIKTGYEESNKKEIIYGTFKLVRYMEKDILIREKDWKSECLCVWERKRERRRERNIERER